VKVPDGYKRCKCRDGDGRELGPRCPKLKRRDGSWNPNHGTYYGKTLVPVPDGEPRADLRAGGFEDREEMTEWFAAAIALLSIPPKGQDGYRARIQILELIRRARRQGEDLPSPGDIRRRHATGAALELGTTGDYLLSWLERHEHAQDRKKSTLRGYREHVTGRLIPHIGEVPLQKLNADHIWVVFDAVDRENLRIADARASGDPELCKSVAGRRVTGTETKRRILATLRSALGEAATSAAGRPQLIAVNPAAAMTIGRGEGKQKSARSRARLWTSSREAAWRKRYSSRCNGLDAPHRYLAWKNAAMRPSNVMIWKPGHLGEFLDSATEDRLYAMFSLIAYCGLRRGEACGLRWEDVDFDAGAIAIGPTIVQVGWDAYEQEDAKSDSSEDWVRIEPLLADTLKEWRKIQVAERLKWGAAWKDTGRVFTRENGEPYHPAHVSERFCRLAFAAGMPPVRLHDLRHGAATLALAAGKTMKEVQALMRHSSESITSDIYASVMPELKAEVSAAVVEMVPRKNAGRFGRKASSS
jgi:integrase